MTDEQTIKLLNIIDRALDQFETVLGLPKEVELLKKEIKELRASFDFEKEYQ